MYSRAVLVERLQSAIEKVAGSEDSAGARGSFDIQVQADGAVGKSQSGRAHSAGQGGARNAGGGHGAGRPAALAPAGGAAEPGLLVDGSPLPPLRRLQLWLDLLRSYKAFPVTSANT